MASTYSNEEVSSECANVKVKKISMEGHLNEMKPDNNFVEKNTQNEVELKNDKSTIDKNNSSCEISSSLVSNHLNLGQSHSEKENVIDMSSPDEKEQPSNAVAQIPINTEIISQPSSTEALSKVFFHILIPFLIAGCGNVGAGRLLEEVRHWKVFVEVPEIFILVPSLLGLKGNLEMCLASRLSTHSNLGTLDCPKQKWRVILGNLALEQCQSVVVGFLASIVALIMTAISDGKFDISHSLLLCASSIATASTTSFVLGLLVCMVVVLSRKCHINPDNIATPVAAGIGDLITLTSLSLFGTLIHNAMSSFYFLPVLLMLFYGSLLPLWIILSKNNVYVSSVLLSGWMPIILAVVISSGSGYLLEFSVTVLALGSWTSFQPIINGVGGNIVAIQSSRLSTGLHRESKLGKLPDDHSSVCISPVKTFFSNEFHAQIARMLIAMSILGHIIFMFIISALNGEVASLTVSFGFLYILASTLQVVILLYFAVVLVHLLWSIKSDPDTSSIPILTALGDLLGTALLICVILLKNEIEIPPAFNSTVHLSVNKTIKK